MTAADKILAEDHLRELQELLTLALSDGRPEHFLQVLRSRIADVEQELQFA